MPRVDRDPAELHDVEQRGEITANEPHLRCQALVSYSLDANRWGRIGRRALLIERLSPDTVWEALHHQRAIGDRRQDVWRDLCVVAHEIALRPPRGREED